MAEYVHEAVFEYPYDDERIADTVAEAVRPEVGDIEGDRTRATLRRDGDTVIVTVRARDLTALRAGINTWGSLVSVAERIARG
ncbi:MAG: KEOPS complex subunit Pcc1 [Halobacteriales archaeon]|jgi:KEOPS complex subunit Pcc1